MSSPERQPLPGAHAFASAVGLPDDVDHVDGFKAMISGHSQRGRELKAYFDKIIAMHKVCINYIKEENHALRQSHFDRGLPIPALHDRKSSGRSTTPSTKGSKRGRSLEDDNSVENQSESSSDAGGVAAFSSPPAFKKRRILNRTVLYSSPVQDETFGDRPDGVSSIEAQDIKAMPKNHVASTSKTSAPGSSRKRKSFEIEQLVLSSARHKSPRLSYSSSNSSSDFSSPSGPRPAPSRSSRLRETANAHRTLRKNRPRKSTLASTTSATYTLQSSQQSNSVSDKDYQQVVTSSVHMGSRESGPRSIALGNIDFMQSDVRDSPYEGDEESEASNDDDQVLGCGLTTEPRQVSHEELDAVFQRQRTAMTMNELRTGCGAESEGSSSENGRATSQISIPQVGSVESEFVSNAAGVLGVCDIVVVGGELSSEQEESTAIKSEPVVKAEPVEDNFLPENPIGEPVIKTEPVVKNEAAEEDIAAIEALRQLEAYGAIPAGWEASDTASEETTVLRNSSEEVLESIETEDITQYQVSFGSQNPSVGAQDNNARVKVEDDLLDDRESESLRGRQAEGSDHGGFRIFEDTLATSSMSPVHSQARIQSVVLSPGRAHATDQENVRPMQEGSQCRLDIERHFSYSQSPDSYLSRSHVFFSPTTTLQDIHPALLETFYEPGSDYAERPRHDAFYEANGEPEIASSSSEVEESTASIRPSTSFASFRRRATSDPNDAPELDARHVHSQVGLEAEASGLEGESESDYEPCSYPYGESEDGTGIMQEDEKRSGAQSEGSISPSDVDSEDLREDEFVGAAENGWRRANSQDEARIEADFAGRWGYSYIEVDEHELFDADSESARPNDEQLGYIFADVKDESRIHTEFDGGSEGDLESNGDTEADRPDYESDPNTEDMIEDDLFDCGSGSEYTPSPPSRVDHSQAEQDLDDDEEYEAALTMEWYQGQGIEVINQTNGPLPVQTVLRHFFNSMFTNTLDEVIAIGREEGTTPSSNLQGVQYRYDCLLDLVVLNGTA